MKFRGDKLSNSPYLRHHTQLRSSPKASQRIIEGPREGTQSHAPRRNPLPSGHTKLHQEVHPVRQNEIKSHHVPHHGRAGGRLATESTIGGVPSARRSGSALLPLHMPNDAQRCPTMKLFSLIGVAPPVPLIGVCAGDAITEIRLQDQRGVPGTHYEHPHLWDQAPHEHVALARTANDTDDCAMAQTAHQHGQQSHAHSDSNLLCAARHHL